MRLEGKVAIVTGGASSMGAAEVLLFAREGAAVVIADLWEEGARQVESEVNEAGGRAQFLQANVSDEGDWERLIQFTEETYGPLDILVNNAGLSGGSFEDPSSTEGWHAIMDVNATGVFLGTKHAVASMRRSGGGSIVNISSIMGFVGSDSGHPAYHASKGAVRIFTKATAVRYGPEGIRANSVHPGFMPPMRSRPPGSEEARAQAAAATPLRRTGEPIEVANGVLFLASDEASFVTGTELVIDGGYIAR